MTTTPDLTILFGTQSGNAERIAGLAAEAARLLGWTPQVQPLDAISPPALAGMPRLLVVVSSYGAGEMPATAGRFWTALAHPGAARLERTHFAVLALGDRAYETFCRAGRLIEARLTELGAAAVAPRFDSDLDSERGALRWLVEAVGAFGPSRPGELAKPVEDVLAAILPAVPAKPLWHQRRPYPATIFANQKLSGAGSAKEVRHVALDLGESGLTYEPGDSLGIRPLNDPALVDAIVARLGVSRYAPVPGRSRDLATLLSASCEIVSPSAELVAAMTGEPAQTLQGDVLSLLSRLPQGALAPGAFVDLLKPLRARSYSIASSPLEAPGRIDLTVATVRWQHAERAIGGVCSAYLADRLAAGASAGIFVSPNPAFRLPKDSRTPIIMIGPGTGVAPFLCFLQHRRAQGASGQNWLFFGDRHRATDFLYCEEFEAMAREGLLSRLDLAFSRDQAEKRYVQHAMRENGAELFAWLERGAVLYLCGARAMAVDVEAALLGIAADHGGLTQEAAGAYLDELKRDRRYRIDVY